MASAVNNTEHNLVMQYAGGEVALPPRVLTVLNDNECDGLRGSDFFRRLVDSGLVTFRDNAAPVQESLFVDTVAETASRGKIEVPTVEDGDAVVTTESGERAATVVAKRKYRRSGSAAV